MTDIILNQHVPGGVMKQLADACGGITYDQYAPGGCMGQLYAASGETDPLDQYYPGGALGQIEEEIEAGDAPAALVSIDFKNDQYAFGGSSHTRAETVEQNTDWGTFDQTKIVAGVGLRVTGAASASSKFVLTAAATDGLLPADGGFTAVVTYTVAATGGSPSSAWVTLDLVDLPDYNEEWTAQLRAHVDMLPNESSPLSSMAGGTILPASDASTSHIAAITMEPANLSGSIDGNAVSTVVEETGQISAATHIAMVVQIFMSSGTGTATLEKIEFYAPVANELLPGLSGG